MTTAIEVSRLRYAYDAQGVIDRILNTWTNAGSNP